MLLYIYTNIEFPEH